LLHIAAFPSSAGGQAVEFEHEFESLAGLTEAVGALTALPPNTLTTGQLQAGIAAILPLVDQLGGWIDQALGELTARSNGWVPPGTGNASAVPVPAWLRDVAGCSALTAGTQVRTATLLRELPAVAQAVLDGQIGQAQAHVLTRLVGKINSNDLAASQEALITVAADRDPHELGVWVRHLIATHCEPQLDADERTAAHKRYLQTRDNHDGTLTGRFRLPTGDAESLLTAVEPLARPNGLTDSRSAGQRRADALVEICQQVVRHGQLPEHGGHRPQLSYVLPADWAARQAERALCPTCSLCPQHRPAGFMDTVVASQPGNSGVPAEHACATSAWTGPQTRARIEALLCDARISRVLLDSVGQVCGLETLTDQMATAQRRALAARDGGCTARGCTRPPAACDAHHLTARADGGPTELANLALLCRRHHLRWHQGQLQRRDLHLPWLTQPGTGPPGAAAVA